MSSHVFDSTRWAKMTVFEQMGNIGSEVGRALIAMQRRDDRTMEGAYWRGLDLIDETIRVWGDTGRRRELLRAREQFSAAIESRTDDPGLNLYFMQFAIAARRDR